MDFWRPKWKENEIVSETGEKDHTSLYRIDRSVGEGAHGTRNQSNYHELIRRQIGCRWLPLV